MGSSGHRRGLAFQITVTPNIQGGVFLLTPLPHNFQFFERPGCVPSFKNECLLPTVFAALEGSSPKSGHLLGSHEEPGPLPGGGLPTGLSGHLC